MTLVNPAFSPVILAPGGSKDSRWLTLEVCREFARSKCSRTDEECKYAHPPPHVEIQNGRVTCCFDSIKGKCQRIDPPCKYLHPPQHLKEILLQNGRQNLIIKNLHLQTTGLQPTAAVVQLPGIYQLASHATPSLNSGNPSNSDIVMAAGQYLTLMPQGSAKHPYLMPGPLGYTYYRPQSIGNVPTIMHGYRNDGNLPVSMATNQMVGSLSGASVAAARVNGLAQHLVESAPSVNKQLENYMLSGGSSAPSLSWCSQSTLPWESSSSPSNSVIGFESTSLPFCQPVSYKHQLVEVMTAMGRKRPHEATALSVTSADDLILGVNAVPVPVLKRPALLDPQSGFPIYQQYASTSTYPSVAALSALQLQQTPQIVSLTDTGATQVIPRIN